MERVRVTVEGSVADVTSILRGMHLKARKSTGEDPPEQTPGRSQEQKAIPSGPTQCLAITVDGGRCKWRSNAPRKTRATPFVDGLCQFHKHWRTKPGAVVLPRDWA